MLTRCPLPHMYCENLIRLNLINFTSLVFIRFAGRILPFASLSCARLLWGVCFVTAAGAIGWSSLFSGVLWLPASLLSELSCPPQLYVCRSRTVTDTQERNVRTAPDGGDAIRSPTVTGDDGNRNGKVSRNWWVAAGMLVDPKKWISGYNSKDLEPRSCWIIDPHVLFWQEIQIDPRSTPRFWREINRYPRFPTEPFAKDPGHGWQIYATSHFCPFYAMAKDDMPKNILCH